uniref:Disease resistance R13L4/SHOC-2-like LRR domain-containing protein n=1 Tax=Periophthalmus magnuspinnatus TaxID=409849 RepID=A0A3B4B8X5_9GOBI
MVSILVKGRKPKGKPITLKMAQNCVELTMDGKRCLNLSFKEITAVPKTIQKLSEMDQLDLSRNLIRKMPDFIECFASITVLDLHSNYLEEVPVTIGRLQNLVLLNLCNNRLTSLPDEMGLLQNLLTLNLGLNQLDSLPASIGNLKELRHLGLSDNRFTQPPRCLSRLKKLQRVNLDRNPLTLVQTHEHPPQEIIPVASKHYMVTENQLCGDCLRRCQNEKSKLMETEDQHRTETESSWDIKRINLLYSCTVYF